jgi:hypothetical protein
LLTKLLVKCGHENVFTIWGMEEVASRWLELVVPSCLQYNDTGGHITCLVCTLKSYILQTWLTGHTTCETCASEVTNRSAVRFLLKKKSRYAPEVIWTNVFSCPGFQNLWKPVFSVPSKNTDNIKNNSVAFEFKYDVTFNTLRILDISSLNARSGGKLSKNIYVGSRARLQYHHFSFSIHLSLKKRKILYCLPCDSNFKPLISRNTLELPGLVNNPIEICISNLFVLCKKIQFSFFFWIISSNKFTRFLRLFGNRKFRCPSVKKLTWEKNLDLNLFFCS